MNSEELKAACEMAGLKYVPDFEPGPTDDSYFTSKNNRWSWRWNNPSLPAYVAELLTAKVRGRGVEAEWEFFQRLRSFEPSARYVATTVAEQRILAAMAVLGDG